MLFQHKKLILLTLFTFGLAMTALVFLVFRHSKEPLQPIRYENNGALNMPAVKKEYKQLILSNGPREAHDLYVAEGNSLGSEEEHELAHAFGSALFQTMGISALSYCGDEFVYGCYHEVMGEETSKEGFKALSSLFVTCEKNELVILVSCEHGIGHGILSQLGYTLPDLTKALNLCFTYGIQETTKPHTSCQDGVFMEYNMRFMTPDSPNSKEAPPREFTAEQAFAPCNDVDEKFRPVCAYELPLWWVSAGLSESTTTGAMWQQVAAYCLSMPDSLQSYCFKGAGYINATINMQNAQFIAHDCNVMTANGAHSLDCILGAVRRYMLLNTQNNSAVCKKLGLAGNALSECSAYTLGAL
jgi:hypothetical protein